MNSRKVVIGIVSKHYPKEIYKDRKVDSLIRDEIKQAIFDNNAIAIGILPTKTEFSFCGDNWEDDLTQLEKDNLIDQIDLCDGIILQGGLETESYECIIAKYCYDNDIPILGICAGQNNIARALGGTTYNISNPEKHDKSFDDYVHKIYINSNSKLYNIINKSEIMVNSRHKKTIKECPFLKVTATCEDNYPDVIESEDKTFYIGVRFHPESLYLKDENMNNIFKYFIDICKNRR